MDKESEQALVEQTSGILKLAKQVIIALKAEDEMPSFEEPSLTDLLLVAQVIGQATAINRLDVVANNQKAPLAQEPLPNYRTPDVGFGKTVGTGEFMFDLAMSWTGDGWIISNTLDLGPSVKVTTMEDLGRTVSKVLVAIWAKRKGR